MRKKENLKAIICRGYIDHIFICLERIELILGPEDTTFRAIVGSGEDLSIAVDVTARERELRRYFTFSGIDSDYKLSLSFGVLTQVGFEMYWEDKIFIPADLIAKGKDTWYLRLTRTTEGGYPVDSWRCDINPENSLVVRLSSNDPNRKLRENLGKKLGINIGDYLEDVIPKVGNFYKSLKE